MPIKEIIDVDGTWAVDDAEPGRVLISPSQAWIDKNTFSLAQLRSLKIAAIKNEAARRILLVCPDWKILRHIEQREIATALSIVSITEVDFKNILQKKEAIRTASSNIEQAINSMSTKEEVSAYDINNNLLWPL